MLERIENLKGKILFILMTVFFVAKASTVYAQTTNISYQGTLDFAGEAANGMFDFRVSLYDAIELGSQIDGSEAPVFEDVLVEEGLVNLSINFGIGIFDGSPRFIQIEVREHDSTGNYTILQPRQEVFAAPHAVTASSIDGDIIQRGTIGNCLLNSSAGSSGTLNYPKPFSELPLVFLTVDETTGNNGCFSARVTSRSVDSFSWLSLGDVVAFPCDCIHWLAIGPPTRPTL